VKGKGTSSETIFRLPTHGDPAPSSASLLKLR
jgi:hypothetical protein